MSFQIEHTARFWNAQKLVHWRVAADVGAAVVRFAAGPVERFPSGPYQISASGSARGYKVAVIVDQARRMLVAVRFYRA
jgi:hypothetical protein